MKKNIIIAAFAWVAGYSVYQSQQKEQLSDIVLANAEALAGGEVIVGPWYCVGEIGLCFADEQGVILGRKETV